jgi:hypothetical protein
MNTFQVYKEDRMLGPYDEDQLLARKSHREKTLGVANS